MAKLQVDKIVRFERLLHAYARVIRVANVEGREERENDVEHSYFMTLLAWYIVDTFKLNLDTNKLLRYALVHDFVEVYAGDTYAFDVTARESKHTREQEAQSRIAREFPEFADLHETIRQYETQEDAESRFVKALDKVEPVIANFMQDGRTWKEMRVSHAELIENKRTKVGDHEHIRDLLEQILALIEPNRSKYFDI